MKNTSFSMHSQMNLVKFDMNYKNKIYATLKEISIVVKNYRSSQQKWMVLHCSSGSLDNFELKDSISTCNLIPHFQFAVLILIDIFRNNHNQRTNEKWKKQEHWLLFLKFACNIKMCRWKLS